MVTMTERIDEKLQAAVAAGAVPGVVGRAAGPDGVLYEGAAGKRSAAADDPITPLSQDPEGVSIADIVHLYVAKEYNQDDVRQLQKELLLEALPASWKDSLKEKMQRLAG